AAVIPRFFTALLLRRSPIVYGDGEQIRDFLYVRNVVAINLLAASAPAVNRDVLNRAVLNVGAGSAISLNQLLTELGHIAGNEINATYQPARSGDIRESLADFSLLRATLGYVPAVSFAEGLTQTVDAYRETIGVTSSR